MKQNKTTRIVARVTPEEKKRIERSAKELGMTESSYIRTRVLKKQRNQEKREVYNKIQREYTYQIQKIGTNINQLVKSFHSGYFSLDEKRMLKGELERLEDLMEENIQILEKLEEAEWPSQK